MEVKEMENANYTPIQLFAAWNSIFANFGNPKRERCFVKTLKKLFLRETKQAIHEQRESTPLGVPGAPAVPGNLI